MSRPGEVCLKMLAAGVSFPDVMMRQGIHPEARKPPFTPGWDVVGVVDELGEGVEAVPLGTTVAAMPIVGCYAEYLCLPETELVRVPPQLDPAEAVCLVLNNVTAYQMLHRSALAKPGRALRKRGRLVAYGFSSSLVGGKRDWKRIISTASGCAAAYLLTLLAWNRKCLIYSIQMLKRREPDWFRQDLTTLFDFLGRQPGRGRLLHPRRRDHVHD